MDLSKVSDADLMAYDEGRLQDVSDEGLLALDGAETPAATQAPEQSFIQKMTPDANTLPAMWEGIKSGAVPFSDEIQAGIAAYSSAPFVKDLTLGDAYNQAKYGYEGQQTPGFLQQQQIAEQQNPGAYYTGMVGGAVPTAVGAIKEVGTIAPRISELISKNPKTSAAGLGLLSGGVYGAGTAEGTGKEIAQQAGFAGAAGGITGPLGVIAGQRVFGPLAQKAQRLFSKKTVQTVPQGPLQNVLADIEDQTATAQIKFSDASASAVAMDKITKRIKQDFPDNYEQVMQAWQQSGEPLAKLYGSRVTSLAQGAAQYPSGNAAANTFFDKETLQAPERINQAISKNISSEENYYTTVDDILAAGRAKAAPLYKKVEEQLVPIPPGGFKPEIKNAIEQARKLYPSEMEGFADNSVKVLDQAKKILDDEITAAQRAGQGNFARSRTLLTKEFVNQIDEAVPDYKIARDVSGDYLSVTKAMDDGMNFMKIDPELIGKNLSKLTDKEKEAFKIGVGKALRDKIGKKNEGANPVNAIFGSKDQKSRLMKILNPTEYRNLEASIRAEDNLYKMRDYVLKNSTTTSKAMNAADISDPEMLSEIAKGIASPTNGAMAIAKAIGRKVGLGMGDKVAREVSKILYETDPIKKLEMLKAVSGNKALKEADRALVKSYYFQLQKNLDQQVNAGTAGAATATTGNMMTRPEPYITVTPKDKQ